MSQTLAHTLPDTKQTPWQLAAIQLTGVTSLPVLTTSILIYQMSNLLSAMITLLIGNALLWVIRLGIVAMSFKKRESTLDIALKYLGRRGGYFIAVILLVATLAWFIAQTTVASAALDLLVPLPEGPEINRFIQISVGLGIISTLFCMNGIVILRRLCTISLPILLLAFLGVIIFAPTDLPAATSNGLTLAGLPLVLGTNLGVTADLPTFFRHAKSWKASIHALTWIQVVSLVLGVAGLYLGTILEPWIGVKTTEAATLFHPGLRVSLVTLIFVSAICANVANVYSASVGWELLAPKSLVGRKEYLILGLGLTTLFILLANVFSMDFLLDTTDSALVNLCVVLIVGYLISLYQKREPRALCNTYFVAWFIATAINILQASDVFLTTLNPLLTSTAIILVVVALHAIYPKALKSK
ncbi:MAG: hypothetical protein H7A40_07485 [Chlamydiales bacterium]|nr:hypothetical protein [Chlamydiales bacterium]